MKLPEGKKKAVFYDAKISFIIDHIKKCGFTGRCSASLPEGEFSLVFQDGNCLLADFPPHRGKEAFEKITGAYEIKGDFELFDYRPEDLIGAEEANPDFFVGFENVEKDPVNLFEQILMELDMDEIEKIKNKIYNEVEDFLFDTNMTHLTEEQDKEKIPVE